MASFYQASHRLMSACAPGVNLTIFTVPTHCIGSSHQTGNGTGSGGECGQASDAWDAWDSSADGPPLLRRMGDRDF